MLGRRSSPFWADAPASASRMGCRCDWTGGCRTGGSCENHERPRARQHLYGPRDCPILDCGDSLRGRVRAWRGPNSLPDERPFAGARDPEGNPL